MKPNIALKPTRFRSAPAVGLALRWAYSIFAGKHENTTKNRFSEGTLYQAW